MCALLRVSTRAAPFLFLCLTLQRVGTCFRAACGCRAALVSETSVLHVYTTCKKVVLGADVFYSSEHFDSVLATAFMLLSATPPCPSGVCGGVDVDTGTDAASSVPCGVGNGSAGAGAGAGVFSAKSADAAAAAAAAAVRPAAEAGASTADREVTAAAAAALNSPRNPSLKPTTEGADGCGATRSIYGTPFSSGKGVFLTAYHERSARRSLRPLLRKWGMAARVLHGAPRKVLPPSLWESGRYDSVALLEITLVQ